MLYHSFLVCITYESFSSTTFYFLRLKVSPLESNFPFFYFEYVTYKTAHQRPEKQNLFGIVQGGLDPVLRYVTRFPCLIVILLF